MAYFRCIGGGMSLSSFTLQEIVKSQGTSQGDFSGIDQSWSLADITVTTDGYISLSNMSALTNTANNDGYINIIKNNVTMRKAYLNTDITTNVSDIKFSFVAGDVISIKFGFDNEHTYCRIAGSFDVSIQGGYELNGSESDNYHNQFMTICRS